MSTPDPRDPYRPPPDSGQPPPREPQRRRPSRAPSPAPSERPVSRAGRTALLIGIAGVGMTIVLFPVGLVLDATAVVLGLRARKRAREAGVRAPGALAAIVLGVSSTALLIGVLAVFGPQLSSYSQCLSGANTEIAKENCRRDLIQELERRFGIDIPQTAG